MPDATVLDLLEDDHSVHTVGYYELVSRVAVVLNVPSLAPNGDLRQQLDRLASLRNRLIHSPADVDIEATAHLLVELAQPLFDAVRTELAHGFTLSFLMLFNGTVSSTRHAIGDYEPHRSDLDRRALALVAGMRGQTVPRGLLGLDGEVRLPDLTDAALTRELGRSIFFARGELGRLLVAVTSSANNETMRQLMARAERYPDTPLWVVAYSGPYPYVYRDAWISTTRDLEPLERLLGVTQTAQ